MLTQKKYGFQVTIFIVCLVTFSGCLFSQIGDQKEILTTGSNTPATPDKKPSTTMFPITQNTSPTLQVDTPKPSNTFLPPALTDTPTKSPSAISAITSPELNSGWIAFVNIANSIGIIQTNGMGSRNIVGNIQYPEHPTWSPDGYWIAFTGSLAQDADNQIYLVRPDGRELHQVTFTTGHKNSISWAPDGRVLVYSQTNKTGDQFEVELFLVEVNSQNIQQLTHTPGVYEHTPAYSPNGNTIAFTSVTKADQPQIFKLMLMNTDGSNIRQVDTPMEVSDFAWSPDGNEIAFTAGDKCLGLYVISLDSSELRRLTDSPDTDAFPTWSSDGKWIAFTRAPCNESGTPFLGFGKIFIINADGKALSQLTETPGGIHPAWSPFPALDLDGTFTITTLGANLNLRSSPSLSGFVMEKLLEGEKILVLEGPHEADEYLWWRVRVESSGSEGWVADNPGWVSLED